MRAAANLMAILTTSVLACLLTTQVAGQSFDACGNLKNGYGPFDYTDPVDRSEKLPIVEEYHFDIYTEMLRGQARTGYNPDELSADLDYTLRAFPNHHRALNSLIRYKTEFKPDAKMRYTVNCYFIRAERFKPDDAVVRLLHGLYLNKIGNSKGAMENLRIAEQLAPESAEIQYNLGLILLKLKQFKAAREHAIKAYSFGYPLPGLKRKLKEAGFALDENTPS